MSHATGPVDGEAGECTLDLAAAFARLGPRPVHAISALLLPYTERGRRDDEAFERLLLRTHAAGLVPAVNMDTGFVDLLTPGERREVLERTRRTLGDGVPFCAGAFAGDAGRHADSALPEYRRVIREIEAFGGTPVIVQCPAMASLAPAELVQFYARVLDGCARAIGFELSPVFAPHGRIYDRETYLRLLDLPALVGAKHSSLDRALELERLRLRDARRPEFRVYTGNDLAIDLVAYGSDYLLGLSAFAPERFAARDRALAEGSLEFLSINDALQHLGNVGFRTPIPAYKHAAAQFLHLTGVLDGDAVHPRAPLRPPSDRILLFDCALRLGLLRDPERTYAERVAPYLDAP